VTIKYGKQDTILTETGTMWTETDAMSVVAAILATCTLIICPIHHDRHDSDPGSGAKRD
jgi:hypothetical protein